MMVEQIDELIKKYQRHPNEAVIARLTLARQLAVDLDDAETAAYVKVGLAREINKILGNLPFLHS